MTDQVDLLIKRAGLGLLEASNLCVRDNMARARQIGHLLDYIEVYLTSCGHQLGISAEKDDPPLTGESMSAFVQTVEEAEAGLAYLKAREVEIRAFIKDHR